MVLKKPAWRRKLPDAGAPNADYDRRLDWLRRSVALAFAVTLLLTPRLWLTDRVYPLNPAWGGLPQLPPPWDRALLVVALAQLAAIAVCPVPRRPIGVLCSIALLWAVSDQSRWQTYFIHYTLILTTLLLVPWERRGRWRPEELNAALAPARWLLAFTYIYAGAHKLNHEFVTTVFPWMVEPALKWLHLDAGPLPAPVMAAGALLAAGSELAAGLALLFRPTRRAAALFLAAMHGFVLVMVGPLGHDWNRAVWPWNVALAIALLCLFAGREEAPRPATARRGRATGKKAAGSERHAATPVGGIAPRIASAGVILLFGVMPVLCFFDRWDAYPGFSLYSGSMHEALLRVDPRDRDRLPEPVRDLVGDDGTIDPIDWSMTELNAMFYPEDRIALSLGRALARSARHAHVLVRLEGRPNVWTGERPVRFFLCPIGGGPPRELPPTVEEVAKSGR